MSCFGCCESGSVVITDPEKVAKAKQNVLQLDLWLKVTAIALTALFALTIVFLGLMTAQVIAPMAALYSFTGFAATTFILIALSGIQDGIAKRHNINIKELRGEEAVSPSE